MVAGLALFFQKTSTGRALRAVADEQTIQRNETPAQRAYVARQIRETLIPALEKATGRRYDEEKLRESLALAAQTWLVGGAVGLALGAGTVEVLRRVDGLVLPSGTIVVPSFSSEGFALAVAVGAVLAGAALTVAAALAHGRRAALHETEVAS